MNEDEMKERKKYLLLVTFGRWTKDIIIICGKVKRMTTQYVCVDG